MKMSDLAKLAGVSKSTVSRALANSERVTLETRQRIQKLAEENGYRLNKQARNLRMQNIRTIGVLLPYMGNANWLAHDPFVLEMIGVIADALEQQGDHELLLAKHSSSDPSWISDFAKNRGVDGIIVIGQSLFHEQLQELASWLDEMVVWGAILPDANYVTVGSDDVLGGKLAAQHLIDQGRTHLAFIGDTRFPETAQRYQGFSQALAEAGLQATATLTNQTHQDFNIDSERLSALFQNHTHIDGAFVATDMLCIRVLRELNNLNKAVPGDVALVGYDNLAIGEFTNPAISSVTQDRELAGKLLVDKVIALIDGKPTEDEFIPTELVVRASSQRT